MSLCISMYPNKHEIIVAADTRKSIKVNGKKYVLDDNCNKLNIVHDKLVFMCGSSYQLLASIVSQFEKQSDGSVEKLRNIAKRSVDLYLKENDLLDAKGMFICNLLAFYFDKERNVPVVYNFHSEDDFKIRMYDHYGLWTNGAKCDEAKQYLRNNLNQSLDGLIFNAFCHVSCEEIGGFMTMYKINEKGISFVDKKPIPDKRKMAKVVVLAEAQWDQISDTPNDLAYLSDIPNVPNYITSTKITSTTIESPNVIGGTITGGEIIGGTIQTKNTDGQINGAKIVGSTGDLQFFSNGTLGLEFYNGMTNYWSIYPRNGRTLIIGDEYADDTKVSFHGKVDFSVAEVTGLNVVPKFG